MALRQSIEPSGTVEPGFEPVAELLAEQVAEAGRGGAAAAVYFGGENVVDVWCGAKDDAGTPWEAGTLAMSFSTTKGVTSTALHMCVDRGLLGYDDRVADHWPEFAQNGKEDVTVRQVLCHEAGLHPIRSLIEHARVMSDWDAMVRALETATPAFEPGTANAYQGLTYGWLVGELVRRTSGKPIGTFVEEEIATPLGCDGLYIGLPAAERDRLAMLLFPDDPQPLTPGRHAEGNPMAAIAEQLGVDIDPVRVMDALLPHGMQEWLQSEDVTEAPVPAANGCFTARSLACMYAALAGGGRLGGVRLLSEDTIKAATEIQNTRPDLIIIMPPLWRLGYHAVWTTRGVLASGFGHSGFGGSGAWADPERDLSLAMTVNRIAGTAVGDTRIIQLSSRALECAR